MEVTYKRNLHKSYVCIKEQKEIKEKYELRMLEGMQVPHLLKMEIVAADGEKQYWYDISGKQQLEDYLSGKKMDSEMLRKVLYSIRELCLVLPDYLLREEGICLEQEYIYVNLEDESLYFTYFPFWNQSLPEAFKCYMEQMLRKIDHQDLAATELGYQVYQRCILKNADIQGILESIIRKEKWGKPEIKLTEEVAEEPRGTGCEGVQEANAKELIWKREENQKKCIRVRKFLETNAVWVFQFLSNIKEKNIKEKNLEEKFLEKKISGKGNLCRIFQKKITVKEKLLEKQREKKGDQRKENQKIEKDKRGESFFVLEAEESIAEREPVHPTEILGMRSQEPIGKLMYRGIHGCRDILIEGEEFLVGKNRQQAKGIIEAEGISRLHARISMEEGIYYLEDLNSTNGTYLNGEPVEYHQKKKLCKGDCIRFGAEEFLFS